MDENLPTKLDLTIVTPERPVVHESALAVSVPGKGGYLGILPGHAPLLSELKPGQLSYTVGNVTHYVVVTWGFVEVLPDRVTILVQASERPEEIDVERARRAKQRAEERLSKPTEAELDRERAQAALERAMARLEVANRAVVSQV
jgi:F-type H+-transporting ATPase subunit epsilon